MNRNRYAYIAVVLGLLACSGGRGAETYFPLNEGRVWEYEGVTETKSGELKARSKLIISNLRARELQNKNVTPMMIIIKIEGGDIPEEKKQVSSISYVTYDATGVLEVAMQDDRDKAPRMLNPLRLLIPNPIKVGQADKTGTRVVTIEAVSDKVTVPAGTFENCIRVNENDTLGQDEIWYAPNVGEIQRITHFAKMKVIIKLISYKR
jgi:hypothetical protein